MANNLSIKETQDSMTMFFFGDRLIFEWDSISDGERVSNQRTIATELANYPDCDEIFYDVYKPLDNKTATQHIVDSYIESCVYVIHICADYSGVKGDKRFISLVKELVLQCYEDALYGHYESCLEKGYFDESFDLDRCVKILKHTEVD